MTALEFEVLEAVAEAFAATPTINLRLRIRESTGVRVHAIALKGQIRIEPQLRHYDDVEEHRLYDMFGERPQWGESLRPFLWTHVGTMVTGFTGETEIDLPVACTYDLEVTGTKYFHALAEGDVPLVLLFSGTTFSKTPTDVASGGVGTGGFVAEPVTWSADAKFRMPLRVWRDTMDLYFPNSGWMRLDRSTIDALTRFKATRGLPTWDLALERLLKEAGEAP